MAVEYVGTGVARIAVNGGRLRSIAMQSGERALRQRMWLSVKSQRAYSQKRNRERRRTASSHMLDAPCIAVNNPW